VTKKAATMSVLMRENLKRSDAKHANGSAYNRVNMNIEDLAYACVEYGLEEQLTDPDRENYANDFDAELETAEDVQVKLLTEREIRVAALIFNTGTWTGASLYTDVSAAPWDAAASDAIAHVLAGKEKVRQNTGFAPDSMAIGAATLANLLGNTGIKNRFPGAAIITEAMLRSQMASIFGLQNLFVGGKVYDSAKEGQAFSGADIWSDDYAMIFKRNTGSTRSGGLGRTMLWTPLTPEIATVEQYREEQTKSDIFRVTHYLQEKVFDASFGHLLKVDA
jgi:hypothetical protein